MSKSKASGYSLSNKDASIVLGMISRGDRDHDIAAYFGVNQGRIADVKDGRYDASAATSDLPPKGPPGVKGRRLRASVAAALAALSAKGIDGSDETVAALEKAIQKYDANEA